MSCAAPAAALVAVLVGVCLVGAGFGIINPTRGHQVKLSTACWQATAGRGSCTPGENRTSLGVLSKTLAMKTRWLPKGIMTPRGKGAPAPNREALSTT